MKPIIASQRLSFGEKYIYTLTHTHTDVRAMEVGAAISAQAGRAPSRSLGAEGGYALRKPEAAQGPGPSVTGTQARLRNTEGLLKLSQASELCLL